MGIGVRALVEFHFIFSDIDFVDPTIVKKRSSFEWRGKTVCTNEKIRFARKSTLQSSK